MKVKVEVVTRAVVELEIPETLENDMNNGEFDSAENYIRNYRYGTLKGVLINEINNDNISWEIL